MGSVDAEQAPLFAERLRAPLVADAYRFASVPLLVSAVFGVLGAPWVAAAFLGLALFVMAFFRNPERVIPVGEDQVVSPADGRVIEVGEVEEADGSKRLRIGIFLSVFNVHVNRVPLAGRVISIDRGGSEYLAAFNRRAESRNVRCSMTLETAAGVRVRVVQITGLIARRIICHPAVGEWLRRGDRYGLIRFGSRTDVVLPLETELRVARGDRVKGGSSVLAVMEGEE